MKNIDDSLKSFEQYKTFHERYMTLDLSESDTRSKLIDELLINVLGWEEIDIRREGHVESGYYDYKISVPGIVFIRRARVSFFRDSRT